MTRDEQIDRALHAAWVGLIPSMTHGYRTCNGLPDEIETPIGVQCFVCQGLAALACVIPGKEAMIPKEWA